MIVDGILFTLGVLKSVSTVNNKYSAVENLIITMRSFKSWFVFQVYYIVIIVTLLMSKYASDLLGDKLLESVSFFGTLGNGLSFMVTSFLVSTTIYALMKVIESDDVIEGIELKYELEEIDK